jgi:hypothetical protein
LLFYLYAPFSSKAAFLAAFDVPGCRGLAMPCPSSAFNLLLVPAHSHAGGRHFLFPGWPMMIPGLAHDELAKIRQAAHFNAPLCRPYFPAIRFGQKGKGPSGEGRAVAGRRCFAIRWCCET